MIDLLIVEDNERLRVALAAGLEGTRAVRVVGACGSGAESLAFCLTGAPTAILMDVQLDGSMNGIEAAVAIRREFPRLPVVFYSIEDDDAYYRAFRRSGILSHYAYVRKSNYLLPQMILPLLQDAVAGRSFIDVEIGSRVQEVRRLDEQSPMAMAEPNEQVVAQLLAQGLSNEQIAARLGFRDKRTVSRTNGQIYAAWGLAESSTEEKVARTRAALIVREGRLLQWDEGGRPLVQDDRGNWVVIGWYAGRLESSFYRLALLAGGLLVVAGRLVPAFPGLFPSFDVATHHRLPSDLPALQGAPLALLAYPLYGAVCYALALDALRCPGASKRFMGQLGRQRARFWLIAASLLLLCISIGLGVATFRFFDGVREGWLDPFSPYAAQLLLLVDLVVLALLGIVVVLLGRAVVSYEIFTGKVLPRGGLRRYWRNGLLLAGGYGFLMGASLGLPVDPIYRLLLATLLITVFYALLSWRSYADHERSMERLRPFVASQHLYDRLLKPSAPLESDVKLPFSVLCEEVLGARVAYLVSLGPLASLVGTPLTYPAEASFPVAEMGSLAARLSSPGLAALPVDPHLYGGATWAIPLWSELGLVGALLIGDKRDGALYVQEEIEVARATGERLIDVQAGAELAARLMAVQRRQMAETQVVDRRTRRMLHDEVLPSLHTALLTLSTSGKNDGPAAEVAERLAQAHRRIADLLREAPLSAPEVELKGAFDAIDWWIQEEAEERIRALSPVASEVVYGAAREAVRNAARHGRGKDSARSLRLSVTVTWQKGLAIAIEDDGVGMGSAAPSEGGSGRGLALHSAMMAVLGGTLGVETVPGRRTRVTLALPELLDSQDSGGTVRST